MSKIYIFCEESSGGMYLAARKHFKDCILEKRDVYLVVPKTNVKNLDDPERIILIDFPKNIWNLFANFKFLLTIKKMQIKRDDILFSHGIRAGFLVSISLLRRLRLLIHRHINRNLSFIYKLFLFFSPVFFTQMYSVSQPEIFKKKIIFFPVLSPFILEREETCSCSSKLISPTPNKKQAIRILWLSRLDYPKKPQVLIQALENISSDKYFVTFVGDGYYRDEIAFLIKSKKINGQIIDENDPLDIIESHDVIVLISSFEGIPFVLQEAMFMNKLVLCNDLPGIRFLGANSFIYVNEENIAHKINSLFDESQRALYRDQISEQWIFIRKQFNSTYKGLT